MKNLKTVLSVFVLLLLFCNAGFLSKQPINPKYKKGFDSTIYHDNTSMVLLISAVNGPRLYTNNKWPNPVVLKIEDVEYLAHGKSVEQNQVLTEHC